GTHPRAGAHDGHPRGQPGQEHSLGRDVHQRRRRLQGRRGQEQYVARLGLLHPLLRPTFLRSPVAEDEAQGEAHPGGEEAADGVQRRAVGETAARVRREPLPDRAAAHRAGARAGPQRGADQDLVPEQAGQDQEGDGLEEPAGAAAHGAGPVQPHHRPHRRGRGGGAERHDPGGPAAATAAAAGHVVRRGG
ncbi:hypothetical protein FOCC_FOCC001377, partial [Frankliniella occidentalis]